MPMQRIVLNHTFLTVLTTQFIFVIFLVSRNVSSVGFSSFIPSSVEFDEETEDYKISMILNDFKLDGMYFLTGSHHLFYPIVGAGPFDITLYGVSSTGTVVLKNNGRPTTQINLIKNSG